MVQQSFYCINRIVSTFNRIESLGQLLFVFLIETYLNIYFRIVIVSTSIRLKKIANRNPLIYIILKCTKIAFWTMKRTNALIKTAAPNRKMEKLSSIRITRSQVRSRKTKIGTKIKYPTILLVSSTIGWNIQRVPRRIPITEMIEERTGHHWKSISNPYEFLKVSCSVPGSFKTPMDIRVTVSMIWKGASIATWVARMSWQ